MRDLEDLIAEQELFSGLDRDALALLAGCAHNAHAHQGEALFREGDPADRFYLVRRGRVALELAAPGRDPLVVETIEAGEVVGWSWLVPPYRWSCDGVVTEETDLVVLDGACLRGKCDADPALGYALLSRVTHVMLDRLQATRVRLLDLYGTPRGVG